jgi:hypothetical protein
MPAKKVSVGLALMIALLAVILRIAAAEQGPSTVSAGQKDVLPATALELTEKNYDALRDYILPGPKELRWQQIPWRATWREAMAAARKEKKPIYVWAMNGHPLGNC